MRFHDFTFELDPHASRVLECSFKVADVGDYWLSADGIVTLQFGTKEYKLQPNKPKVATATGGELVAKDVVADQLPGVLKDVSDVEEITVMNDTDKPVNVVVRIRVK